MDPGLLDTPSLLKPLPLELNRREATIVAMTPNRIVEHFNIIEDVLAGVFAGF
jgi:hypothetical protein